MSRHLLRRALPGLVVAGTVVTLASPASAINTYNSAPAPERTEVGRIVALWDTDGDAVADRIDWVSPGRWWTTTRS